MNILRGVVEIPRILIFVLLIGVSAVVCLYFASQYANSPLIFSVTTGLVGGLSIFLLDKIVDYKESLLLGARDWILFTLSSRDDRTYYSKLIGKAKIRIYFVGKTAFRLLTDFADIDAVEDANRRLLVALQSGIKIRFLLADASVLDTDDQRKVDQVAGMIGRLRERAGAYGANLEVRYYKFAPSFSVFVADDTVVFGPNFPGAKSRATPSIVSDARGRVAQKYIDFFEEQWALAGVQ